MTKLKKHKFWVTVTALIIFGAIFFPQINSVKALLGVEHSFEVLFRFWNEIASKSEAGRYYQGLIFKHSDELTQIFNDHQQHVETEFLETLQIFTPGLEALVNGKGDTVQITEEQVILLQAEADWMYSFAGPALRLDIEKEQQRFPLDNFIGMTMSEALDYVNSNWKPDPLGEALATPTISSPSTPVCLAGPDPDCLEKSASIPGSNGQWAYYTYDNVYFEYPSAWQIQQNGNKSAFVFLPTPDSSEGLNLDLLLLQISSNRLIENWNQTITDPQLQLARANTGWMQLIYLNDFQGFEVLVNNDVLEVMLYDENDRVYVDLLAYFKNTPAAALMDSPDAMEKAFPNIQHMIESVQIWKP